MPRTVSRPGFDAGDPISTAAQVDHPQSAPALPTIVDEEPRSPGSNFALVAACKAEKRPLPLPVLPLEYNVFLQAVNPEISSRRDVAISSLLISSLEKISWPVSRLGFCGATRVFPLGIRLLVPSRAFGPGL